MTIIKSLSVGNGDMFYIKHLSDSFTVIDCCLDEENKDEIISEINSASNGKGIKRFISTHPDEDHIRGLDYFDDKVGISNFYCVKNKAQKEEITDSFTTYCKLRDGEKAYFISKGIKRKWLNDGTDERGSAGISFLWPKLENQYYIDALKQAEQKKSPNNISPIIQYSTGDLKILWMGDLETEFMENIFEDISLSKVTVIFAPHHGRDSGKIPQNWLDILNPKLIVIGEALSDHLNYYDNYNTITQNSAGTITFVCKDNAIDIYVENEDYSVDFLKNKGKDEFENYIGTLTN